MNRMELSLKLALTPEETPVGGHPPRMSSRSASTGSSSVRGVRPPVEFDWAGYGPGTANSSASPSSSRRRRHADRYKLSQQADVLNCSTVPPPRAGELFGRLGTLRIRTIPRTSPLLARSSHGPRFPAWWNPGLGAIGPSGDALLRGGRRATWPPSRGARRGGGPSRSMPARSTGGARVTGIEMRGLLRINPSSRRVERLDMRIRYRGHSIDFGSRPTPQVRGAKEAAPITLHVRDEDFEFPRGTTRVFSLRKGIVSRRARRAGRPAKLNANTVSRSPPGP